MHLPVLAASLDQVRALGVAFTPAARALARPWWPGPLTLAFGFEPGAPRPAWLAGRDEVAVRIPDHDFLRALLARTGRAPGHQRQPARCAHTPDGPGRGRRAWARTSTWSSTAGRCATCPRRWSTSRGREPSSNAKGAVTAGRGGRRAGGRTREPAAAGHRDLVRRDGGRRRRRRPRGALVRGGQPDRPARGLRRGGARAGQPGPRRDDHADRRAGAGRGRRRPGPSWPRWP